MLPNQDHPGQLTPWHHIRKPYFGALPLTAEPNDWISGPVAPYAVPERPGH